MKYLALETEREGYAPRQCSRTVTVGELIDILEQYDENMKVYFSNDEGYTYGSISASSFEEKTEDEDEE